MGTPRLVVASVGDAENSWGPTAPNKKEKGKSIPLRVLLLVCSLHSLKHTGIFYMYMNQLGLSQRKQYFPIPTPPCHSDDSVWLFLCLDQTRMFSHATQYPPPAKTWQSLQSGSCFTVGFRFLCSTYRTWTDRLWQHPSLVARRGH